MRENRSAYEAHNALKSAAALSIARELDLARTRAEWCAVLTSPEARRANRRTSRSTQRGRASFGFVALLSAVSAAVSSYFGG